jgi:hypothetical protein
MRSASALLIFGAVSFVGAGQTVAQAKPTTAEKIADAIRAAPSAITGTATIMDWPATEGGTMATLRPGTNGWTCLPDFPMTEGRDPMCVDEQWMAFMHALMTRTAPRVTRMGIGYMAAPGGGYGSNTDPFATKATEDNEWGWDPPHLMLLVSNQAELQGLPTKREQGGPWVMFAGTPYVHLMVPVAPTRP